MTEIAIQIVVLLAVVTAIAIWLFRSGKKADTARAARFSDRENLETDDWEHRFYAEQNLDSVLLREALDSVADALDIPAGKLRPSDRFDVELAPIKGWETDDGAALLSSLLRRRGVGADRKIGGKIRTLDEYVRAVAVRDRV